MPASFEQPGPQGPKGDTGPQGAKGDPGATGPASPSGQRGPRIAAIGDSIVAFPGTPPGMYHDDGDLTWAVMLSGGKLKFAGNFGVGGYTVQQIRDDLLPKVLALDPAPDWCLVSAGSNNMEHDAADIADAKAALLYIFTTLRAANIEPIVTSVGPYGGLTATGKANMAAWDAWLGAKCAELGVTVIDTVTPLVDPATGNFRVPAERRDDAREVHPKGAGYMKRAQVLVDALTPKVRPNFPKLARDNVGATNVLGANRLFLAESATPGLAENLVWVGTAGTGGAASLVTGDSQILGNWQRFVTTASDGFVVGIPQGPSNAQAVVTPGHRYSWAGRLKVNSLDEANGVQIQLYWANPDNNNAYVQADGTDGSVDHAVWIRDAHAADVFEYEFTMPAVDSGGVAIAHAWLYLSVSGAADFQIAQLGVYDLTALGL